MTSLQREISDRSRAISTMGYLMAAGLVDIDADYESIFQTAMAVMIIENEKSRDIQNRLHDKNMEE